MPSVEISPSALQDLERLRSYLYKRNPEASKRASQVIRLAIQKIPVQPSRFRPVPNMPNYREAIVDFGSSGYIIRFCQKQNGNILIARVKHQLENDYPNLDSQTQTLN